MVKLVSEAILGYLRSFVILSVSCITGQGNDSKVKLCNFWSFRALYRSTHFRVLVSLCWSYWYRFLGWWSIDEGSREEQARLYYAGTSGLVFCCCLYLQLLQFCTAHWWMFILWDDSRIPNKNLMRENYWWKKNLKITKAIGYLSWKWIKMHG